MFDQTREIFSAHVSASDLNKRSDQPPDHLPQKMRGRDSEEDQMLIGHDFGGFYADDRRLSVAFRVAFAESREVMTARNRFSRARHLADVKSVLHPPDVFFSEGRAPRRDLIKIAPRNCAVAGVKTIGGLFDFEDVDVRRQTVVDGVEDLLRTGNVFRPAPARREFQMGGLRQSVNAGVGAPGAADLDLSIEETLGGLAQFAGDRARVRLLLPSAVTRAVVFKREFPRFHKKWAVGSG